MHSVRNLPEGVALPPIQDFIVGRPTSWSGMTLTWPSDQEPVPVFVERFGVPSQPAETSAFLFGTRYYLSEVLCDGETLGDGEGHFLEYFVVEESSADGWLLHRLLQRASVTHSEDDEPGDYLPARDVDAASHSVEARPQWKASDAGWPTYAGTPMKFLGQVHLPENDVTRALLNWDWNVYLFWTYANGTNRFKIIDQPSNLQTAEEHYADEERRRRTS